MTVSITDLPTELLTHVCSYLDRESLCSLALANRLFHPSTASWLYLRIKISDPDSAANLYLFLTRTSYAKYVRQIIVGRLPRRSDADAFPHPVDEIRYRPDRQISQIVHQQDSSWRPVANLVQILPSLRDLVWACPEQIPPCIVRAVTSNGHLSSCRLHLRTFRLRSLEESAFDSHELDLIRLPNLHDIWFIHDLSDKDSGSHRSPEIIFSVLRSFAPNLRYLRFWEGMYFTNLVSDLSSTLSRLEQTYSRMPNRKASLKELVLVGVDLVPPERLIEWSQHIDFSVLESLIIYRPTMPETIELLANMTMPSVRKLFVNLGNDFDPGYPEDYHSNAGGRLLANLPRLLALGLVGRLSHSHLHGAMVHHGPSLTRLCLRPSNKKDHTLLLGSEQVEWISQYCIALQELEMTVKRSMGSLNEVSMYRAVGRIARLQTLDLTLNSAEHSVLDRPFSTSEGNPWFDELKMVSMPYRDHLREMLINTALDETLARTIYDTMAMAKPARGLPLAQVRLHSKGGGEFGAGGLLGDLQYVFRELGRGWSFEMTGAFCKENRVTVKEIDTARTRIPICRGDWSNRVEPVFRSLWPSKTEDDDWRNDWHSFPLCT